MGISVLDYLEACKRLLNTVVLSVVVFDFKIKVNEFTKRSFWGIPGPTADDIPNLT